MKMNKELFHVQNSDWTVAESKTGLYMLFTSDGTKKIEGLSAHQLVSAQAVLAELDRHIKQKGGK